MNGANRFHVELRQFPNSARAFNLTAEQLRRRFLDPWVAGEALALEDRTFSPEKAKLTIYEAPELSVSDMGLGRGWANVTKRGRDVTATLLEQARSAAVTPADEATEWLKAEIVRRAGQEPRSLHDVLDLANLRYPGWRVSDRLAVAERAVWELLHQGELQLLRDGEATDASAWERAVLDWEQWRAPGSVRLARR